MSIQALSNFIFFFFLCLSQIPVFFKMLQYSIVDKQKGETNTHHDASVHCFFTAHFEKNISSQCARGKSFIVRNPAVHPKMF